VVRENTPEPGFSKQGKDNPGLVRNLNLDMKVQKPKSALFFLSTIWWFDALKRMKGIVRRGKCFWTKEKETRVKIFQKTLPRFFLFSLLLLFVLFKFYVLEYFERLPGVITVGKYQSSLSSCYFFLLGGMFTANTMSSVVETLGLTLPGMQSVTRSIKFIKMKPCWHGWRFSH